jgi:hypothetical protein
LNCVDVDVSPLSLVPTLSIQDPASLPDVAVDRGVRDVDDAEVGAVARQCAKQMFHTPVAPAV